MQSLLGAVADYASISLVNARLFRVLKESADSARDGEKKKVEQLQELQQEMQSLLQSATYPIDLILTGKMGMLSSDQKQALDTAQSLLQRAMQLVAVNRQSQPGANQQIDNG